ncbi:MAG TPA: YihY family inner membrane protein [Arcobacter sp.]|nr:YihY family inner membrane protein [Arcobacter sp.]HIP55482.1 YihY family inner membrane protein [Arcobacter sp.]
MKEKIKHLIDFFNDDTLYYSASLSFFTIFSILPILALLIVVMSSSPIFSSNIDLLMLYVLDFINPTHSSEVTNAITHFLKNIDQLGSLGIFYLIFVFTMFFKDYEYIVSKIHKTKKRSFIALVSLYISFLLLIPITFVLFISITTLFTNPYIQIFLNSLFAMFIFTVLFKISVNKHISLRASVISAFLTLGSLKLTQTLFIYYVLYNTTYSTIYGTLSIMLFMFLWIYISWTIYLYGIKICHKLNLQDKKNAS